MDPYIEAQNNYIAAKLELKRSSEALLMAAKHGSDIQISLAVKKYKAADAAFIKATETLRRFENSGTIY